MNGFITSMEEFTQMNVKDIIELLTQIKPEADASEVMAWRTLIEDIKGAAAINGFQRDLVIGFEYMMPINGMYADLILAGRNAKGQPEVIAVEAKQWNDEYIARNQFSQYRNEGKLLHPQIQVSRYKHGIESYLSGGENFSVKAYVYVKNASASGVNELIKKNPIYSTKIIPVYNNVNSLWRDASHSICKGDSHLVEELGKAKFRPSIGILDAMKSIATREEPFILSSEQEDAVKKIENAILRGKKIIKIIGCAGSGKTAILLNLYVNYLNKMDEYNLTPYFVSGAQNTALYRSLYPSVSRLFAYSYEVQRIVTKEDYGSAIIFMDEAQHNEEGLITDLINAGAILVICYDIKQAISANNAVRELRLLENRRDFLTIQLMDSVRFNGSQFAEINFWKALNGQKDYCEDELFDFRVYENFNDFQKGIMQKIINEPESTFAVTGLLSNDALDYTVEHNGESIFITKWKAKEECNWIPYVYGRKYLEKFGGKLWVGTWWMPGLDVDYVAVIIGGNVRMTKKGIVAVPEQAKQYRMIVSIAKKMNFPEYLYVMREKKHLDYYKSASNIIWFINKKENNEMRKKFIDIMSLFLKNNYYINMSRGRKGCYVLFTNHGEFEKND